MLRIVDFFAGIGGLSAAIGEQAEVVAAYDIDRKALEIGAANFRTPIHVREIAVLSSRELAAHEADLWWMSPPCQPYSIKGKQRDLDDPRAQSFLALLERIGEVRPAMLALENVPGFAESRTRAKLLETASAAGYSFREELLCPTSLGIPGRRLRYYFVASQRPWEKLPACQSSPVMRPPASYRDEIDDAALLVPEPIVAKYRHAMHIVDRDDPQSIAACFTSSYGRSPLRSGSYLRCGDRLRYFSPREILRLLGFPASFRLPEDLAPRRSWPLIGNSLSIDAVRAVLAPLLDAEIHRPLTK